MHIPNEHVLDKINDDIWYWCIFFIVPWNGQALLGITDCECLLLQSLNCQMTNDLHKRRLINDKTKQDKFKTNSGLKNDLCTSSKINHETNIFIAGLAQRQVQKHQKCTMNIMMSSQELHDSKACSHYRLKVMPSHTRYP